MSSFASRLLPVAIASVLCGIAMAGGDKGDHMKMMDANSDGKVTATEHADAAKKMFTKMDADKDGRVTAAEMDAAHPMMKHHQDKDQAAAKSDDKARGGKMMSSSEKIAVIDTNGDGQLTAEEHAAGSKKMFSKMDTDSDGTLTAQELRDGHRTMMTASD
ncbi:MAG: hypothetical protein ABW171_04120 [Steroidobacter sp.]